MCYLRAAVVDAKWGLEDLWVKAPFNPFKLGHKDLNWTQAYEKYRAQIEEVWPEDGQDGPPVNTVELLREACVILQELLGKIDRWHECLDYPNFRQRFDSSLLSLRYSPNQLISSVWAVMRSLPGENKPIAPAARLDVRGAISELDRVVNWCDQQRHDGESNPQESSGKKSSRARKKKDGSQESSWTQTKADEDISKYVARRQD